MDEGQLLEVEAKQDRMTQSRRHCLFHSYYILTFEDGYVTQIDLNHSVFCA